MALYFALLLICAVILITDSIFVSFSVACALRMQSVPSQVPAAAFSGTDSPDFKENQQGTSGH